MEPELKTLLEKANSGIEGIGKDVTALGGRVELLEKASKQRATDPDPRAPIAKDKFSFCRALKAISRKGSPNWKGAEYEEQAFKEGEKLRPYMGKALNVDDDGDGGFLVPQEYLPQEFIELLYAKSVVRELGATVMGGLTGIPVVMSKMKTGSTFSWIGKSAKPSQNNAKFGQVTMTPKRGSAHTRIQKLLVQAANPSAEAIVMKDLASIAALGTDLAYLRGAGGDFEPLGVRNVSGINTVNSVGADGDEISVEKLYDAIGEIEDDNADMGALGWACHPRILRKLRKLRADPVTADKGDFLLTTPALVETGGRDGTKRLLDYPLRATTQIPKAGTKGSGTTLTEMYFGNWQDLMIGEWGAMEIRTSDQASDGTDSAFLQNELWVVLDVLVDVAVRRPESFVIVKDLITA